MVGCELLLAITIIISFANHEVYSSCDTRLAIENKKKQINEKYYKTRQFAIKNLVTLSFFFKEKAFFY